MSEELKIFDQEAWDKRHKELRSLDVFISEYLWNEPCIGYGFVDNYDGDETVSSNEDITWREEKDKEPLYEPDHGHKIKGTSNFESYCLENVKYNLDLTKEEFQKKMEEEWKICSINGIHIWNLRPIPTYSLDLNLIHRCEKKLYDLGQADNYCNELNLILNDGNEFVMVNASAEIKARAIVETLKSVKNERSE